MAMTPCRECGASVSTEAAACPYCGISFPGQAGWSGTGFEWKSARTVFGFPLVHVAFGRDARGKRRVAKGVIAIGQFAIGLVTVAQFGVGVLFGFGQFIAGLTALAQFAVGIYFGIGQFAAGYVAIGQFVVAYYGMAQVGFGQHIFSTNSRDPAALSYFQGWWAEISRWLGSQPF